MYDRCPKLLRLLEILRRKFNFRKRNLAAALNQYILDSHFIHSKKQYTISLKQRQNLTPIVSDIPFSSVFEKLCQSHTDRTNTKDSKDQATDDQVTIKEQLKERNKGEIKTSKCCLSYILNVIRLTKEPSLLYYNFYPSVVCTICHTMQQKSNSYGQN